MGRFAFIQRKRLSPPRPAAEIASKAEAGNDFATTRARTSEPSGIHIEPDHRVGIPVETGASDRPRSAARAASTAAPKASVSGHADDGHLMERLHDHGETNQKTLCDRMYRHGRHHQ